MDKMFFNMFSSTPLRAPKWVVMSTDFDTGEDEPLEEFDNEEDAEAYLHKLGETATCEDDFWIWKK